MRLDKLLEGAALGSRKQVKRLLITGQVRVNETVVRSGSFNVDPNLAQVTVSGQVVAAATHTYLMLYKPAGVVTAVTDAQHPTVIDLVASEPSHQPLFPVGRLDRDSEGLVLLTDNGPLAYHLLQPRYHVSKTYEVKVNGLVTAEDVAAFARGIVFEGGVRCASSELVILTAGAEESHVRVTIAEGKSHQIKKMFLAVGKKVIFLKRLSMGKLQLSPTLAPGQYRALTLAEIADLSPYFNPVRGTEKNK